MRKIGIVTITSGANYGNRLQNYAMQVTLKKLEYNPYTIRKIDEKLTLKRKVKNYIKHFTKYKYTLLDKRIELFEQFNREFILFSNKYIKLDNYDKELCDEFDGFICGSDQIWNPNYKMNTGSNFLSFVKGKKKISVAASMGIEKITEKDANRIGVWLRELDNISVREIAAKKICEEITNKEVSVLVDPTLTLSADEWRQISKKPKNIKQEKFILCYLLGNQDKEILDEIKRYSMQEGKRIVFLEDIWRKSGITSDEEYLYGPSEFVWLVEQSDEVITDSFHAAVFSIIFRKKFAVIPREDSNNNMNSRFTTLFQMLDIENAMYKREEGFDKQIKIDYQKIDNILKEEKEKFYGFIKNNL